MWLDKFFCGNAISEFGFRRPEAGAARRLSLYLLIIHPKPLAAKSRPKRGSRQIAPFI
jgi:hypothetical protein